MNDEHEKESPPGSGGAPNADDPIEMMRTRSNRLQYQLTVGISNRSRTLPTTSLSMGQGKANPPPLPNPKDYLVDFNGSEDPLHPFNWTLRTK